MKSLKYLTYLYMECTFNSNIFPLYLASNQQTGEKTSFSHLFSVIGGGFFGWHQTEDKSQSHVHMEHRTGGFQG